MLGIKVSIVRFVDVDQPGWVECRLVDAAGVEHLFVEKAPVVSSEDLWTDSLYPRPGVIACRLVAEFAADPAIVIVDTEEPWGVTSTNGKTRFDVLRRELLDF